MSSFWQGMERGNTAAVETMGEEVLFDGTPVQGVVDDFEFQEAGAGVGGRRSLVNATVLVSPEVALRDGMPVVVRGLDGKVGPWRALGPGGHVKVSIGPFNRWSGEIPGL